MVSPSDVSACLITKEKEYPREIMERIRLFNFAEVLVITKCDSPHRKQELFRQAACDLMYYQDDDCIAPIMPLLRMADPGYISCAMKDTHIESYKNSRIALVGWGSIIPKWALNAMNLYLQVYGEDHVYRRESERIMTWFNYPQLRLPLNIVDLPSAFAPDRLSMQPDHYDFIPLVEQRCKAIVDQQMDISSVRTNAS